MIWIFKNLLMNEESYFKWNILKNLLIAWSSKLILTLLEIKSQYYARSNWDPVIHAEPQ